AGLILGDLRGALRPFVVVHGHRGQVCFLFLFLEEVLFARAETIGILVALGLRRGGLGAGRGLFPGVVLFAEAGFLLLLLLLLALLGAQVMALPLGVFDLLGLGVVFAADFLFL